MAEQTASPEKKKSMNTTIILVIIAVLIVGAILYYTIAANDADTDSTVSTTANTNTNDNVLDTAPDIQADFSNVGTLLGNAEDGFRLEYTDPEGIPQTVALLFNNGELYSYCTMPYEQMACTDAIDQGQIQENDDLLVDGVVLDSGSVAVTSVIRNNMHDNEL